MIISVRNSDNRVMSVNYDETVTEEQMAYLGEGYSVYSSVASTSELDAIITEDLRGGVLTLGPFVDVIYSGGVISSVTDNERYIELTTDAEDTYQPVDGIPDIPADGSSTCNIYIKKINRSGAYCQDAGDDDQIDITSSRGNLGTLRTNLVNGEATIVLTSVAEECVSKIIAFGSGEGAVIPSGTIQIQFAPTD